MRICQLILSLVFLVNISSKAQLNMSIDRGNYQHTINTSDGKITLFVLSDEHPIKSVYPHKNYYWYSNNKVMLTQGGFSGKLLHGTYKSYYLNKNLHELGDFKRGLKDRSWKTWADNGNLKSQIYYKDGVEAKKFYKYDQEGKLYEKGRYRNGEISGNVTRYMGDSTQVIKYRNGNIVQPSASKRMKKISDKIKTYFKKAKPK